MSKRKPFIPLEDKENYASHKAAAASPFESESISWTEFEKIWRLGRIYVLPVYVLNFKTAPCYYFRDFLSAISLSLCNLSDFIRLYLNAIFFYSS